MKNLPLGGRVTFMRSRACIRRRDGRAGVQTRGAIVPQRKQRLGGVTVNGKEIISTPGHKYYLPETKAWVSAEDLKIGDNVGLSNI